MHSVHAWHVAVVCLAVLCTVAGSVDDNNTSSASPTAAPSTDSTAVQVSPTSSPTTYPGAATLQPSASASAPGPPARPTCPMWDYYTLSLLVATAPVNPFVSVTFSAAVGLPDGTRLPAVHGFYDGQENGQHAFRVRAYCGQVGRYTITTISSLSTLHGVNARYGVWEGVVFDG